MNVKTAVITAAGLGTRLRPVTAVIPKVMLPLVDVPAVQWVVEEALEAQIERVVIVIGHGGELIRRHFEAVDGPWQGRIEWVEQSNQRGLGHAVLCAQEAVEGHPFALLFGDSVFAEGNPTRELLAEFETHGEPILAAQRVPREEIERRGIFDAEPCGGDRFHLRGMVEKPKPGEAPSDLAFAARAVLPPELFAALAEVSPDSGGEIQLTPAIDTLAREGRVALRLIREPRLDIGNPADYAASFLAVARARRRG